MNFGCRGTMVFMEIKIGNVTIPAPLIALAPMAGTSTVTFRGICHGLGSSYAPTELVSARSIVYNGTEKSFRYLEIDPENEGVTCIQLFGNDPEDFKVAIEAICNDPRLQSVDIIDVNMGCPVPKVVKTGAGSALMKDPVLASRIMETVRATAERYGKAATVKTRIGFNDALRNGPEFAKVLAHSGAQSICVHGRTASQMYRGVADIDAIAQMRDAVKDTDVVFIANGDITDGESAKKMMDITKADGIMIGRASMGDPWIFNRVRHYLNEDVTPVSPSPRDKCDMLLNELVGTASHVGEPTAVKEMRSVMPHYIKGLPGSAVIKTKLCLASTIDEVREILEESIKQWE